MSAPNHGLVSSVAAPYDRYQMSRFTLRPCRQSDFLDIWTIINDGASAYRGIIPPDCLHDPYMTAEVLSNEITNGVEFWAVRTRGPWWA